MIAKFWNWLHKRTSAIAPAAKESLRKWGDAIAGSRIRFVDVVLALAILGLVAWGLDANRKAAAKDPKQAVLRARVFAAREIPAGTVLTSADTMVRLQRVAQDAKCYNNPSDIHGRRTLRVVPSHHIIELADLEPLTNWAMNSTTFLIDIQPHHRLNARNASWVTFVRTGQPPKSMPLFKVNGVEELRGNTGKPDLVTGYRLTLQACRTADAMAILGTPIAAGAEWVPVPVPVPNGTDPCALAAAQI
jgi:hypothetical protein